MTPSNHVSSHASMSIPSTEKLPRSLITHGPKNARRLAYPASRT